MPFIMGFRPSIPLHYLGCVHCPNEDHSFSDRNVGIFLSIYAYNKVTPKGGFSGNLEISPRSTTDSFGIPSQLRVFSLSMGKL